MPKAGTTYLVTSTDWKAQPPWRLHGDASDRAAMARSRAPVGYGARHLSPYLCLAAHETNQDFRA